MILHHPPCQLCAPTSSQMLDFVRGRLGGDMQDSISRLRALSGYRLNVMAAVELLWLREQRLIDEEECDARAVAMRDRPA